MENVNLPSWAKLAGHQEEGRIPRVDVNAAAMMEVWLGEFAASPANPEDFPGRRVRVHSATPGEQDQRVPAMMPAEAVCDPRHPTQYWLECALQCMKLDLQVAAKRFAFEIRLHNDAEKKFALNKWPPGRGIIAATYGFEAKAHYKRIRGFLP